MCEGGTGGGSLSSESESFSSFFFSLDFLGGLLSLMISFDETESVYSCVVWVDIVCGCV